MNNDTLANMLSNMRNAEKIGKESVQSKPASKMITTILEILQGKGYITGFEVTDDGRGGIVTVQLSGHINKCGVIKPRFSVKLDDYEKYEQRYLPAKDFGIIFVSTSQGIMSHIDAKEKKLGGKLLAYCY